MLLLIDSDLVSHRVGFGCESKVTEEQARFEGSTAGERIVEPVEVAIERTEALLQEIFVALGTSEARLYLTDSDGNFRKTIYPDYKANRKGKPRPVHLQAIEDYLIQSHGAVRAVGEEADDLLGISQTICWENNKESVICSIDKDLLMIPGSHYNFIKKEFTEISPEEGQYRFYTQLLMGDATDNISGCPKVGEKKAEKALQPFFGDEIGLCHAVYEQYSNAYPNLCIDELDDMITMIGQLVNIRKHVGELWQSPLSKGVL